MMFGDPKRNCMKLKDKELERERTRERKLESETVQESPTTNIKEHFSHPHPLTYTQPDDAGFRCNSCAGRGQGQRYHCAQCDYDLHKVCAQSPVTWLLHHMTSEEIQKNGIQYDVIDTFAHSEHSIVAEYRRQTFTCDLCKNPGDGLRFLCVDCNVGFHQVCARNPTRLISHLHPQHELELQLRPYFKPCNLCRTQGPENNRMYRCKVCEFYLHPVCSQWPLYLVHPLHPPHPLVLRRTCSQDDYCSFCRGSISGYKYICQLCELNLDLDCIWHHSRLGLGEELRKNDTGRQATALPVTNLTLPDFSKRRLHSQGHPKTGLRMFPHFPDLSEAISDALT